MPPPAAATGPAERQFAAYCQQINPIGDMRRVVVAAEAAARYLEIPSVDPDRLSALFTLAGWTIPHSFVQTLRNAARSKFRWMERVPRPQRTLPGQRRRAQHRPGRNRNPVHAGIAPGGRR